MEQPTFGISLPLENRIFRNFPAPKKSSCEEKNYFAGRKIILHYENALLRSLHRASGIAQK